jgi:hypothetical protein
VSALLIDILAAGVHGQPKLVLLVAAKVRVAHEEQLELVGVGSRSSKGKTGIGLGLNREALD